MSFHGHHPFLNLTAAYTSRHFICSRLRMLVAMRRRFFALCTFVLLAGLATARDASGKRLRRSGRAGSPPKEAPSGNEIQGATYAGQFHAVNTVNGNNPQFPNLVYAQQADGQWWAFPYGMRKPTGGLAVRVNQGAVPGQPGLSLQEGRR